MGFPGGSDGKESTCNVGAASSTPGLEVPLEKTWQPTQLFLPGNSLGHRGAQWATVHGIAKESDTTQQLNNNNKNSCKFLYIAVEETKVPEPGDEGQKF